MAEREIKYAETTLKGARSRNEDAHGTTKVGEFLFMYVCDGHGGAELAKRMGAKFNENMAENLKPLDPSASAEVLVETLRKSYWTSLKQSVSVKGGTTFTASVMGLQSYLFAVCQVGDSMAGVCDVNKSELITAEVVHFKDDADGFTEAESNIVFTRIHGFNVKSEEKRWRKVLQKDGLDLQVNEREDCHPLEDRVLADVTGLPQPVHLPEPSRAIESAAAFEHQVIHDLQRSPEFVVWQLPKDRHLCVFAVCDGFMSKLAMPTPERFASCLCEPGKYFAEDNFTGTVFEDCEVVEVDAAWKKLSVKEKLTFIKNECELPDDEWQEAHKISCDALLNLDSTHGGSIPTMVQNPQAAVEAAAHLAVMLLSDDNITATVALVAPP